MRVSPSVLSRQKKGEHAMAHYRIDFPLTVYVTEILEANSAEEALDVAMNLIDNGFDSDLEERFEMVPKSMENLGVPEVMGVVVDRVTITQELIDEYIN